MERAVNFKTYRSWRSHDNLTIGAVLDWLSLDVAQFDESLVQVDVLALQIVMLLEAPEQLVGALLQGEGKPFCQVNVDLGAHVLSEHC